MEEAERRENAGPTLTVGQERIEHGKHGLGVDPVVDLPAKDLLVMRPGWPRVGRADDSDATDRRSEAFERRAIRLRDADCEPTGARGDMTFTLEEACRPG
jgi:hypothetical protein